MDELHAKRERLVEALKALGSTAVAFSAGVQTNQFKYYEANAGIGLMF